jgi:hypothetical protein
MKMTAQQGIVNSRVRYHSLQKSWPYSEAITRSNWSPIWNRGQCYNYLKSSHLARILSFQLKIQLNVQKKYHSIGYKVITFIYFLHANVETRSFLISKWSTPHLPPGQTHVIKNWPLLLQWWRLKLTLPPKTDCSQWPLHPPSEEKIWVRIQPRSIATLNCV